MPHNHCVHLMMYVVVFLLPPPLPQPKTIIKLMRFLNRGNIAYIIDRASIAFHGGYNAPTYGAALEDGEILQCLLSTTSLFVFFLNGSATLLFFKIN